MESSEPGYHLEINGIAEGPLSAKELAWKAGMAGPDDVLRYRREGSDEWQPLDGNLNTLQHQTATQHPPEPPLASPPKLKLKKKSETPPPFPTETPPPFPTEAPPPPPGDSAGTPFIPESTYTDDNPPPPPGAPMPPMPQLGMGTHASTPPQPSAPATPPPPPPKLSSLLVASLVLSVVITAYLFLLMKQEVACTATRKIGAMAPRGVGGIKYTVLTKSAAEEWKSETLEKLTAIATKAQAEADASGVRVRPLVEKADELTTKYEAVSKGLFLAGANARLLAINLNPDSPADVKSLRILEAAMEIAEPYLSPAARNDLDGARFRSVALAVTMEGFPKMISEYEAEIRDLEVKLSAELALVRPFDEDTSGLQAKMMYSIPADVPIKTTGMADPRGQFSPKLAPGEYYLIASTDSATGTKPSQWAIGFTVQALADNAVQLNEANLGNDSAAGLWKPDETLDIERNIRSIRDQVASVRASIEKIQGTRRNIEQRKKDLEP